MDRIHILTTPLEKYHLGLGARDKLRTEMGYPLWGNDIDSDYPPDSAGLPLAVDISGHEFRGRIAPLDRVANQTSSGPRSSTPIKSGTYSPIFPKPTIKSVQFRSM